MAGLRGPTKSSCVIVGTYLPFFFQYFQVATHPESYLVDFSSRISFSLELPKHAVLGLLDSSSSSFPDSSFQKQEKNVESLCVR